MKIDTILDEWREDSVIDSNDLDNESLKIPNIHSKYLEYFIKENRTLKEMKTKWKVVFQERWEATVAKQGKLPKYDIRISKNEYEKIYVQADDVLQEFELLMNQQQNKVDLLEKILKMIEVRGFNIKNAIDWRKFVSGIG